MEQSLLSDQLILLDYKASDRESLLQSLSEVLQSKGYVKQSFAQAIIAREAQFPTGLNTPGVHLAMPHTDPRHVNRPAILVARLQAPVRFKEMGGSGKDVDAGLIFMLAVTDPKSHLETLRKLMAIFSDQETLLEVYHASTKREILEKLELILA